MIGEVQIYLAHIGRDDKLTILAHKVEFNKLVRHLGGMPTEYPCEGLLCTIAFTEPQFRNDFVFELKRRWGICAAIDFHEIWIDRRYLPPESANKVAETLV